MHQSSSAVADAFAISNAFRAARDDDTMRVLNVFSSKKESDLADLSFYVVPAAWLRKAWPILTTGRIPETITGGDDDSWREQVGQIETGDLIVCDQAAISSDEEEPAPSAPKNMVAAAQPNRDPQRRSRSPKKEMLSRDLVHGKDFFLFGSSSWLLVKEKFGADTEIRRKCVFYNAENPLAVEIHPGQCPAGSEPVYIPITPSGRFPYEEALAAVDVNKFPLAIKANGGHHPGNVSDDDTADCGDDLFPADGDDDRMSTDHSNSNQPVLLLTNSATNGTATNRPSWQSNHGMEVEKDEVVFSTQVTRRRYGSGLGNLGNTCFMNSTLQCLAHTDPLRKYFLSGEYENDLNRDNPLGTGGDLAIQFSRLLGEMWWSKETNSGYSSSTGVVYPRNFKYALGRHAEQFVGYDQHDSQELATYLLDALHEDTNRVTSKPYIEKPEQGENETDEEAADKAWTLHLKREDSKVLEFFMGQVKSRVQCCKEDCGRVSTTFDPFMYLSVPIPGSSDRTIRLTFVPLDPMKRAQNISVTVHKNGTMEDLAFKLLEQLKKLKIVSETDPVTRADLCMADVWNKDIYSIFTDKDEIDRIRDNDDIFVYQLEPLSEVREIEKKNIAAREASVIDTASLGLRERSTPRRYKLDLPTLTRINRGDEWWQEMTKFLRSEFPFMTAFNPKRGSAAERVKLYNKLLTFIDQCYQDADPDLPGQKRSRDESLETTPEPSQISASPDEDEVPAIRERCESSPNFQNVARRHDVAILEFLAGKMRAEILRLEKSQKVNYPDGVIIQVRIRKHVSSYAAKEQNIAVPLVLRVPSNTTVYRLREIISNRLSRSLRVGRIAAGESSSEKQHLAAENGGTPPSFGSPELMLIRQIPFSYERKMLSSYRSYTGAGLKLGALDNNGLGPSSNGARPVLANPTDAEENVNLAELLGEHAIVHMEWPEELAEKHLDLTELETVEHPCTADTSDAVPKSTLTVLDCIEKFCQKEQLEETEMWYCNRCKEHVRAWKQFHLYRAPPILIIHLKRFQYSASTHRRDKIGAFVDFPLVGLDLTQHFMQWRDDSKPIYDCYAVSNHYGGLGGGHYTAYALNDDGVWCHYDDSRVTSYVDPKEVVSQASYVLYYRRQDVPLDKEFAMGEQCQLPQTPAIIQDPLDKLALPVGADDVSNSNVAMVDEDEADGMDVDDTDIGSRSVGSMDGNADRFGPPNLEAIGQGLTDESNEEQFLLQ